MAKILQTLVYCKRCYKISKFFGKELRNFITYFTRQNWGFAAKQILMLLCTHALLTQQSRTHSSNEICGLYIEF